jgi:homoserine dehydrogenase
VSAPEAGPRPHLLFSYGTLGRPAVQASLFGGPVPATPDAVTGHVVGEVRITDPAVVALSGSDVHPALLPSGDPADRVAGVALELDDDQLAAADAYESAAYSRVPVRLASGRSAWAYVPSDRSVGEPPTRSCAVVVSGLGSVGSGLLRLLQVRARDLRERHGLEVVVVGAVDSRGAALAVAGLDPDEVARAKARGASVADLPGAGRPGAAVPEVLAELEALGRPAGLLVEAGPADLVDGGAGLVAVLEARRRGLAVVLANKAPLALAWDRVTGGPGAPVRWSACVGAALPTVDLARTVLVSATATRVEVVLNSTCQRVLRDVERGLTVDEAVTAARRAGLAEADPSLDVDGTDTAVKLVLLTASLGHPVPLRKVEVTGIRGVTSERMRAERRQGRVVVLLGTAEPPPAAGAAGAGSTAGWRLVVAPRALAVDHPLARLDAHETGVVLHTDVAGRIAASGLHHDVTATAAAVLRDVVLLAAAPTGRDAAAAP